MKVKKLNKPIFFSILIALSAATFIIAFSEKGFLQRLELLSLDFLFHSRKPPACNSRIVIIEINDEDIAKIGRWPWERNWHAAMAKALNGLGAKIVYFDILFSEPSSEENDNLFSEAIKESGNIYLPFAFQGRSADFKNALLSIEKFSSYARGSGAMNIYPDIDGSIRKIPLFFKDKKDIHYHAALRIAADYLGLKIKKIKPNSLILTGLRNEVKIPLIEGDKMLINWAGGWKNDFKHYSFLNVLNGYQDFLNNKKTKIDLQSFKNSICIVGVTAIGLYDIKPTPIEAEYPGIGITATAISNILDNNFIRVASFWINWLLIYILALLPPILILKERPLREIIFILSVFGSFFIVNFLFNKGIRVALSLPLLSLFSSYIFVATYNFARISIEKKNFFKLAITDELTELYNIRYFKMILKAECLMARADTDKIFCIIIGDIDHFKNFNDNYGHQTGNLILKQIAKVIKISLRASDVVARYGGEEIIILLRCTSLKFGLSVAEKIRKNIEEHSIKDKDNTYKAKISLGVSMFNSKKDNEETIVKRADEALYKAKKLGRNRVETIEIL